MIKFKTLCEGDDFEDYHLQSGSINWSVFTNEPKEYLGNCVDVGNGRNKVSRYFGDANVMISFLNECIQISKSDFIKLVGAGIRRSHVRIIEQSGTTFFLYKGFADGIAGFHDPNKDVEYFYL